MASSVRHNDLVALCTPFGYVLSGRVGNPTKYNTLLTLECFLNGDGQEPTTSDYERRDGKVYSERKAVQLMTSSAEVIPEVYAEVTPEVYVLD